MSERLGHMRQELVIETRGEEKQRLRRSIGEIQTELEQVGNDLSRWEKELEKLINEERIRVSGQPQKVVYISSTYQDLPEYRRQVYDVLSAKSYHVVPEASEAAADTRSLTQRLADVAACHVYIGIIAWRYGYIPPDQNQSIIEMEYRQALQAGRPCFMFLLHEEAPWLRSRIERGPGAERLEALRAELVALPGVQFFKSPEELAEGVDAAVEQWAQTRLEDDVRSLREKRAEADERQRQLRERQRVVNLPPSDTYTFKNRIREQQAFQDHLATNNVRLVSLIGRGGMGKTALASRVLGELERGQLPVPDESKELAIDGIIYLSARSTGLSLERIYSDVGVMLGEPVAGALAARWANPMLPLPAKVQYLLQTIRNGVYLMLLDNLEDKLDDDGTITDEGLRLFIEACLTQPTGVRLIVTSREVIKLSPTTRPGVRQIFLRDGLPEEEAIALLRELDPQGQLGLQDAPDTDLRRAAQIAMGIPRALELLTSILEDPTMSLPRLLAARSTETEMVEQWVAEGYRHLSQEEQQVMEALAVFNRPVSETAIAYLLHPWSPGLNVQACLRRLANKNFVSANRVTGQYSLHPLDREYAYRQIPDRPNGAQP
ncbi:MAG: DUF4062 domain-containing protein [Anaerolineae bacterium]|nr:DUF4062 domain-containing protein [Anaerolineae bacterium]